jgi:phosphoribosylformylglycinamidine synthase
LLLLSAERLIYGAHDISDGGLAVTLAESSFASAGLTADVRLESPEPAEFAVFGERGARAVVTCKQDALVRLQLAASQYKVAALEIGRVTTGTFRIQLNSETVIASDVELLRDAWATALEKQMSGSRM